MSSYNPPPDDLILETIIWLRDEIYPGLLNETFDDRAMAVWVCGHRGLIGIWQTNGLDHDVRAKLENAKQIIYRRIEQTKTQSPPVGGGGISGFLAVDRLGFRDSSGQVLPIFCHFGEAFSAYVRRPDEVRTELARIKNAGYQGIRFWDVLGYWDVAWAGKEITPVPFTNRSGVGVRATADYYVWLASFLQELQALGLKAMHSRGDMNSWTPQMIEMHLRQVAQVQRNVGVDVIALNEVCNESWQNGIPSALELKRYVEMLPAETICGTSAADDGYGGETPDAFRDYAVDVQIIHGFRGQESHNRIGHIMAVGYETVPHFGIPGWQSEPAGPGPGVTVGQENNVEALCLMAAMSLSTHQAWTYMSSNGVFWNGSISEMPGFQEVARIPSVLPPDIMNGWDITHGGERWRDRRVFAANADGTLRCDHMFKGDQFQAIIYGRPGSWSIPVHRSFEGEIIRPATLERIDTKVRAGEILALSFERGVIIQGKVL